MIIVRMAIDNVKQIKGLKDIEEIDRLLDTAKYRIWKTVERYTEKSIDKHADTKRDIDFKIDFEYRNI